LPVEHGYAICFDAMDRSARNVRFGSRVSTIH
jgi:hypothetical protein